MKHLLQIETFLFIDILLFLTLSYAEDNSTTLVVRSVVVMEPNDNNNTTKTASKEQLEKFEDNLSLIPLTTNTQMLYDILKSLPPLLKLVEKEFSAVPGLAQVISRLDSKIFDFLQQISDHLPLSLPETSSSSNHSTKVDRVKPMTISNQWNLVIDQMEELVNFIAARINTSSSHPPSELQKWICKALHGIEKIMKRFSNDTKEERDKNSPATESPREVLEDLQEAVFFAFELFEYGEPRAEYSEKEDTLVLKYSNAK